METTACTPRRSGRPLSFDRQVALEKAMLLFWRQGYETTSVSDLTAALGISPPSLYTAFGDKRRLFLEAARHYAAASTPEKIVAEAPTARDAAWRLLEASAMGFTGETTPPGCLLATAAITGSPGEDGVRIELAAIRKRIEAALLARIEQEACTDDLHATIDPLGLAGLVMATIQGMSTLARDGADRDKLMLVARTSMRAWD